MRKAVKEFKMWVEPCIDMEKAIKYCTKEESREAGPWSWGERKEKKQGQRTDLMAASEILKKGGTMKEVAMQLPVEYIKFTKGLQSYKEVIQERPPRSTMTEMHIYWGVAGAGKSHKAWQWKERGTVYELPKNPTAGHVLWWAGYNGQDTVILEDFYGWVALDVMFKLVDKYPYKVRTASDTFVEFTSKRVVITSNKNWELWYAKDFLSEKNWKEAFERRITASEEFKEKYVEDVNAPHRVAERMKMIQEQGGAAAAASLGVEWKGNERGPDVKALKERANKIRKNNLQIHLYDDSDSDGDDPNEQGISPITRNQRIQRMIENSDLL